MANSISIRFSGMENLRDKFLAMAEEARTRTLKQVVPPSAEIIAQEMRHLVSVDSGILQKSLQMVESEAGPGRHIMTLKTPAPHWHLVEFGHRMVTRSGKETGRVAAKPFIRPAFDHKRRAAANEIRDGIRDSILGFTE